MSVDERSTQEGPRLDSWKAIATFLNRDVRTVMRWEKTEGLPVHRHLHQSGRSVYAYVAELDAWQATRRVPQPTAPAESRWRWNSLVAGFGAVVAIAAMSDARPESRLLTDPAAVDRPLDWPENASMTADASMSADGRYVTFVDQSSNELTVKDLRTGRQKSVTRIASSGGWMEWSAISRDSRFVAFASKDAGPSYVTGKLRVLPLDADGDVTPRVVAEGQWFEPMEWSADNRELLVRVERNDKRVDIGIVDVASGAYRTLKRFSRPFPGDVVRRSPDGAFIAYDIAPAPGAGHRDVHLLSAHDGADVTVLGGPSSDTVAGWSPDGRHLLFQSDRSGRPGLWAILLSQGRFAGEPVLLRDDFGAEPHTITAQGDLFYERAVGASGGPPTTALMTATVDPATGALVTPPWFAAHDREAPSRFPRWSADGDSFLYLTRRAGGRSLSIRALVSGQTREIPLNLAYIWTVDWSPDGRSLVFRATDAAGRNGIFLLSLVSSELQLITPEIDEFQGYRTPQFTRDGRSITYFRRFGDPGAADGHTSYVRWDLATRTTTVIEREVMGLGPGRYAMGRSPDGRYRLSIDGDLRKAPAVLSCYDTVTGRETEVFQSARPNAFNYEDGVQWMPDARAVLANVRGAADNAFELWWIPVDGRQPRRIDLGVNNLINSAIAVHPGGRQIAFLVGDPVASTASSPRREFRLLRLVIPDATKRDTP